MALTVLEVLFVICVILFLASLILPALAGRNRRSPRIWCLNNLKQIGLAFHIYAGDNQGRYPVWDVSHDSTARKLAKSENLFRYFQVMSNELNTPKVLLCPEDKTRTAATNFTSDFNSAKVSYFIGLDAEETRSNLFLAGDRNLTNGLPLARGVMVAGTNAPLTWTKTMHRGNGNVLLADGSVERLNNPQLRQAIASAGTNVNRLLFP